MKKGLDLCLRARATGEVRRVPWSWVMIPVAIFFLVLGASCSDDLGRSQKTSNKRISEIHYMDGTVEKVETRIRVARNYCYYFGKPRVTIPLHTVKRIVHRR
jgi:hypothetical protein